MTKQNIDIQNADFAELKGRHVFLKDLTPKEREVAVAKIPNNERLKLACGRFPGADVLGLSFDEAIEKAGLDFEVTEQPVHVPNGRAVPRYKALVRYDTDRPISVVSESYGTIQARDAVSGLRELCNAGAAVPARAWSHDGGRRFGVAAIIGNSSFQRLGADKPETIAHYVVAQSSHDGTGSYSLTRDAVQLVCFNGAITTVRDSRISLRHTSRVLERVKQAQQDLVKLVDDALAEQLLLQRLAEDRFTLKQFVLFADELLGGIDEEKTDRSKTIYQNKVVELGQLFTEGQGNFGVSKLDAFSAVTEWLTPRRAKYDEAKFATKYFNDTAPGARPAKLRERAVRLLTR